MAAGAPLQQSSDALPDSIFTWRFEAPGGDSWAGTLIDDSTRHRPGDTIAGTHGIYTILTEVERGIDLGAFGFDEQQVFVESYFDRQTGAFLPTRNGASAAAGFTGLGSELDAAWTGSEWVQFGQGGRLQADAPPLMATLRFTWVFEAASGDRWEGLLYAGAATHAVGDTVLTQQGLYRITGQAALAPGTDIATGTVRLIGSYHDQASGARFAIEGANGATNHGTAGLGSEIGFAWNGATSQPFGQGGALQLDAAAAARPLYRGFGAEAGGWVSQNMFPRMLADVDGDGRPDVVGFGNGGVLVANGTGSSGFGPTAPVLGAFGLVAGGWTSQDLFPRMMADVNGDGRADVIGFGNGGVFVARVNAAGGFDAPQLALGAFGLVAGGWTSQTVFPRMMADVNGDGRGDVVGFGNGGIWVALAGSAGGFAAPQLALGAFGAVAGGWTNQDIFPRMMADMNGDGRADVVGFGNGGVWLALANGSGGFAGPQLVLGAFGAVAGGWTSQNVFPRLVADVNGDARPDIVGFGNAGVWVSLQTGAGGFSAPQLALSGYGVVAGGWTSQNQFPRFVADINGDGRAEVIGFGNGGIWADTLWF